MRPESRRRALHPCWRSRLFTFLVVALPSIAQERVAAKAAAVSITAMATAIAE